MFNHRPDDTSPPVCRPQAAGNGLCGHKGKRAALQREQHGPEAPQFVCRNQACSSTGQENSVWEEGGEEMRRDVGGG